MSEPNKPANKRGEVDQKLVAQGRNMDLAKTVHVPIEDLFAQRVRPSSSGASAHETASSYFLSCPPLPPIWLRPGVPVRFGRDRECEIILSGALVSRQHAVICVEGPQVILTDIGSTNGCYVNGERVETALLSPGDEIIIGTWGFIFRRQFGAPPVSNSDVHMEDMDDLSSLSGATPTMSGDLVGESSCHEVPTQDSGRNHGVDGPPTGDGAVTLVDENPYPDFTSQTY
jgi:hypothetical protein